MLDFKFRFITPANKSRNINLARENHAATKRTALKSEAFRSHTTATDRRIVMSQDFGGIPQMFFVTDYGTRMSDGVSGHRRG